MFGVMLRHILRISSTFVFLWLFCLDLTRFLVTRKLPCPWEGCEYSAIQKSNLKIHYRTQYVHFHQLNASLFNIYLTYFISTQEKSSICYDNPAECDFSTCHPTSLLRHRKSLHGYIPGSAPRKRRSKKTRKNKLTRVPARGTHGPPSLSPSPSPSPSLTASGSLSHQSQLPSLLPFQVVAPYSTSQSHRQSRLCTYSPTYSTRESEVSPTPATSTLLHNFMQGELHPTVSSMTSSYSVHGRSSMSLHDQDSDIHFLAPPTRNYVYIDPSCPATSEVLDGSWVALSSGPSENLKYMDPVEVVYDSMLVEDSEKLLSPIFFSDQSQEWSESTMVGVLPLGKEHQQQPSWSSSSSSPSPMTMHVEQHPNNPFHSIFNNLPIIEEFHDNTAYHHSPHSHYSQFFTTSLDIAASLQMMPHDFEFNNWPGQNYCG